MRLILAFPLLALAALLLARRRRPPILEDEPVFAPMAAWEGTWTLGYPVGATYIELVPTSRN